MGVAATCPILKCAWCKVDRTLLHQAGWTLAPMQHVLSFDVGLRNLAFAVLDVGVAGIFLRRWGLLNLNPAGKKTCGPEEVIGELVAALDREFRSDVFEYVLIENQPSRKNPTMKSIQVAVHTYFAAMRLHAASVEHIRLVSATQKLLCARGGVHDPKAISYKERKDRSIELCHLYVHGLRAPPKAAPIPRSARQAGRGAGRGGASAPAVAPGGTSAPAVAPGEASAPVGGTAEVLGPSICVGEDFEAVLGVYRAAKKRDDLCDAMLQAVAFAERHLLGARPSRGIRRSRRTSP
jgi:hypothetical protein